MRVRSPGFSPRRGRETAGSLPGLFLLVALAASSATTFSFADVDVAEGSKGLRGGAVAAGAESGKATPSSVGNGGKRAEEGILPPAERSTEKKGEQGKAPESGSVADERREDPSSTVTALQAEPELPAGEPGGADEATDSSLRGTVSEADASPREADQQAVSRAREQDRKQLPSPSDSSGTSTTTTAPSATTTRESVPLGAASAMASSSVPVGDDEDAGRPSSPSSGPSLATAGVTTASGALGKHSVNGRRAVSRVSATLQEEEAAADKLSSLSESLSASTGTPAGTAKDSVGVVQAVEAGVQSEDGLGMTEDNSAQPGSGHTEGTGGTPQAEQQGEQGGDSGQHNESEQDTVNPQEGPVKPGGGAGDNAGTGEGPAGGTGDGGSSQEQQQQQQDDQPPLQDGTSPSSSSSTPTTTTSDSTSIVSTMRKRSWFTSVGLLIVVPLLWTA